MILFDKFFIQYIKCVVSNSGVIGTIRYFYHVTVAQSGHFDILRKERYTKVWMRIIEQPVNKIINRRSLKGNQIIVRLFLILLVDECFHLSGHTTHQLLIVLCRNVACILLGISIHQATGKQLERNNLQGTFGRDDVHQIAQMHSRISGVGGIYIVS